MSWPGVWRHAKFIGQRYDRNVSPYAMAGRVDTGVEYWDRSAFVNSIVGKVERLAANGQVEIMDKAITSRHRFWTLADVAREAREQLEVSQSKSSETIATDEGFRVQANHTADRVQIFFDDKPTDELRGALKAASWHWSRTEGAWQRKLTKTAIASAKHLLGADSVIEQAKAESTEMEQPAV